MARAATAAAVAIAVLALARPAAADRIVLRLSGPAQFEFAGYYAALWQGFYRDAGLEVEIAPGNPKIDPVREVIAGRARFGTGTARLLIRAAEGLPLVLLAPVFQESGAALYYAANRDFSSPAALRKARIGRPPASSILDLELRTTLGAAGVDPTRLRSVPLPPGGAAEALALHRVDAAVGSAWDLPWQARARGMALKPFDPAGDRAAFYGDSLFTLQDFAADHPETVQRFRAASLKGWEYALQHPDKIAARLVAEFPAPVADPAGFARYQSEVARRLAHYPSVALGASDPERWRLIEQSLIKIAAITRPADLDLFLYRPPAPATGRQPALFFILVGIAVGAVLLLAAALIRHRRRALPWPSPRRSRGGEEADLEAMLAALEAQLQRSLPKLVTLRLSLPAEHWPCRADPAAVAATVRALVAEAAADMPEGGEVTLGTRHRRDDDGPMPGDYVRLSVRDSGPGLAPEDHDTIFDPVLTARPAIAAADEMAQRQGGFARIDSAEGVGTAVHLYFARITTAGLPLAAE